MYHYRLKKSGESETKDPVLPGYIEITKKVTAPLTEYDGNQFWDSFMTCLPSVSSTTFRNGGASNQSVLMKILSHAPKVL